MKKFKINLEKIDEKITQRKNISFEKFLEITEDIIKFKNEAKIVNSRYL